MSPEPGIHQTELELEEETVAVTSTLLSAGLDNDISGLAEASNNALSSNLDAVSFEGESQKGSRTQLIAEKYQILEKLGSGGLSTVYKVKHLHLDKIYALKLLHEIKEESVLRFQQEAKAASLLQHQNIIGIVDFGVFNGLPYMVMNCVEGQTLSQYAKIQRQLDPRKFARLFGEICAGLAHAHEKGVVHRDIKPSNIMISYDDNNVEHAVIVDFGIAKITNEEVGNFNSALTRTGDIFGTPLYMSPEQCKGLAVDARSDIYSFACVMYEILTGEPPFCGDSPYEIIHKQITEAPKPFSASLAKLPLIARMEGLILKAMAKAPEDRFQYMLEMSSAIKAIELGAGASGFGLANWNLFMARFRASDKQQVAFKVGIAASLLLSVLFCLVVVLFPAEIEHLSKRIGIENEIIARCKNVFALRLDPEASLFRIKRSEVKKKLAAIKSLANYDREVSKEFDLVSKAIMKGADKIHELRGLRNAIGSNDPAGVFGQLGSLSKRLDNMEFRLGETLYYWSEANLKAVNLTNKLSRQVESEEKLRTALTTLHLVCRVLFFPLVACLLFCSYMAISYRRREKQQILPTPVQKPASD